MTFENVILPFLIVAIEAIVVLLGGWFMRKGTVARKMIPSLGNAWVDIEMITFLYRNRIP
ncbi:MAG: hypothetical protein ACRC13_07490 [Tannerellaceae bacterium]